MELFNFADDTTTDKSGVEALEIKKNLEEDAIRVLELMASNGLVANQSKTEFLLLNANDNSRQLLQEVTVGEVNILK